MHLRTAARPSYPVTYLDGSLIGASHIPVAGLKAARLSLAQPASRIRGLIRDVIRDDTGIWRNSAVFRLSRIAQIKCDRASQRCADTRHTRRGLPVLNTAGVCSGLASRRVPTSCARTMSTLRTPQSRPTSKPWWIQRRRGWMVELHRLLANGGRAITAEAALAGPGAPMLERRRRSLIQVASYCPVPSPVGNTRTA